MKIKALKIIKFFVHYSKALEIVEKQKLTILWLIHDLFEIGKGCFSYFAYSAVDD